MGADARRRRRLVWRCDVGTQTLPEPDIGCRLPDIMLLFTENSVFNFDCRSETVRFRAVTRSDKSAISRAPV
ncbi:unnamed protein product [Phyllotreta striolata]|uniref:Uncharacterized protein n=1 Tax=Phyllotreta striolata TaxID=444603 RepID=A0A9N9TIC5_PHYSR|nr:unnamed protein product [Phyllotreta striolata]